MLNTIRVFFSTGITGGLPMSDSPFRTQLTALPLSLTRDNVFVTGRAGTGKSTLLRLPIGLIANTELTQPEATRKLLGALDMLVIDEVSMVSADLMDGIDRALRQARGRRAAAPGRAGTGRRT
ncbi:hypothetical protein [Ralstonia pickettii]|uniref:hypothetical protein n=1 Tax=Ralstonia pickettii TaxID=329 RepID=UPI001CA53393